VQRFLNGTQAAWDDLAVRAGRACVVFVGCQLPPGCQPATARIGFEVHAREAILFVDKRIAYRGSSDAIRSWLSAGEKRFASMDTLRRWIEREIGPLLLPDTCHGGPAPVPAMEPGELTDIDAVAATAAAHATAVIDAADLLRELRSRVYGQDATLQVLADRASQHVRRTQPRRPATLFALGPTGVGKTHAAMALAESLGALLGGRWSSFIRLSMNEYSERHRVSQLLGAPPSYVGYGDGTQLIDRLAAQPESIVLFDEIEKAHADILVALMGAMDAGELSSPAPAARGRAVDCRRAIFFFTSNIDITDIVAELDAAGTPSPSPDSVCRRHLTAARLRPELAGRIGTFLVFRPLSARARAEIATAAVATVAAEYGLTVVRVAPEIITAIVSRPYDDLGARPDAYYIDDLLSAEFSRYAATGDQSTVAIEASPAPTCVPA
jgi:ATP-dependent Clp protease ATP-binding subunit ClpA